MRVGGCRREDCVGVVDREVHRCGRRERKDARRDCVEGKGSGVVDCGGGLFVRLRLEEEREGVELRTAWSSSSRSATLSTVHTN